MSAEFLANYGPDDINQYLSGGMVFHHGETYKCIEPRLTWQRDRLYLAGLAKVLANWTISQQVSSLPLDEVQLNIDEPGWVTVDTKHAIYCELSPARQYKKNAHFNRFSFRFAFSLLPENVVIGLTHSNRRAQAIARTDEELGDAAGFNKAFFGELNRTRVLARAMTPEKEPTPKVALARVRSGSAFSQALSRDFAVMFSPYEEYGPLVLYHTNIVGHTPARKQVELHPHYVSLYEQLSEVLPHVSIRTIGSKENSDA